jgi:two-component system CheB/CheR fusion protein
VYNTESQQAQEKSHLFSLRNSSLAVASDPALLEQLLTNLVANAIRYTPAHGRILLGCRRQAAHVRIDVIDNGPGIAADALDFIFDEYRQLEFNRPFQGMGLGLGLSIVKLLAQLLHLKLEVKAVGTLKAKPKTGTILLIDDDEAVLDSTNIFLSVSGFRVVIARNSAEALELLHTETPDVVVTDYGLAQQETGIDLLMGIRQALKRQVPAIVVTGNTSVQRHGAAYADENIEIVSKPIDPQVLLQLVQKYL